MSIFNGKKLAVFLHIAAWIIVFLLPIFLTSMDKREDWSFFGRIIIRTGIYALIFYLSYFWLIPKLLFQGKKLKYYLSVIAIIVGLYFVNETISKSFFSRSFKRDQINYEKISKEFRLPKRPWKFDIYNYLFTSFLISGFSVGLRMSGKYNENEKKRKELEKEKLSSELAFLKNQVSPHFFFNTLNNIYSLTEINTKEAQNAILQLSKLMRYLLYESEKGDTKLSNEIAFMKNYIELMKLRLSDKIALRFSFPEEYKDVSFPPLMFIAFIENAFKHGVSNREKSFINIELKFSGPDLVFNCKNSIFEHKEEMLDSGIGLENVKKRLSLLFPGSHQLTITQKDKVFEILLIVKNIQKV